MKKKLGFRIIVLMIFLFCLFFEIILFSYLRNNDLLYLFVLVDGLFLFYLLKEDYFLYFVIFWVIFSLAIKGFTLAPFDVILEIFEKISVTYPTISTIQIFGFISGLFILIFLGYLFSLILVKKLNFLERLTLSFGLGIGINSFIFSILGFIFNLQPISIFLTYLSLFLVLIWLNFDKLKKFRKPSFHKPSKFETLIFLVCLPFILFSFIHVLFFPELYFDSLIYGAEWAKIIFTEKKIPFFGGGPSVGLELSSKYPSGSPILGVFFYILIGNENIFLFRLLSVVIFIFLILLVYGWSKKLFKEDKFAVLSILLLVTTPFVIIHSRVSSFYLYLIFEFSIAFYFLYRFYVSGKKPYLFLASILGGFAALTSYLGLLFFPFLIFIIAGKKIGYNQFFLSIILFLITCSPWYFRNLILLGNPFWPFFGGKYIDPIIQSNTMSHFNDMSKLIGFNYNTLEDLLSSVHRLFFTYVDFYNSTKFSGFRPYIMMFVLPAIFLWLKKRESKFEFFVIWFLYNLIIYTSILNIFERYFSLAIIPVIFLSVYLIKELSKIKFIKAILILILLIIFVNSLYLSFVWDECIGANRRVVITYMTNLGNFQKILETCYMTDIRVWRWVNENLPDDGVIATTELKWYYLNRTMINMDSWRLRKLYYTDDINEIVSVLEENNIKYLVIPISEELEEFSEYFQVLEVVENKKIYNLTSSKIKQGF